MCVSHAAGCVRLDRTGIGVNTITAQNSYNYSYILAGSTTLRKVTPKPQTCARHVPAQIINHIQCNYMPTIQHTLTICLQAHAPLLHMSTPSPHLHIPLLHLHTPSPPHSFTSTLPYFTSTLPRSPPHSLTSTLPYFTQNFQPSHHCWTKHQPAELMSLIQDWSDLQLSS